MTGILKIGTRGSPLALVQVEMVRAALAEVDPALETEVVVIQSGGEWKLEQGEVRLKEADGGKGQFAKELEEALLAGEIDIAVHSMKDMESHLPEGLAMPCMLPREDPRDLLLINDIAKNSQNELSLKDGAVVGTASVRRQAFLLNKRPDLDVVPFRGNVGTRLEKLAAGQVDATLLAVAGLKRLGMDDVVAGGRVLEPEEMLPAAGQGAVGIETRTADVDKLAFLGQINCQKTLLCVSAERAVLAILDGSCHTPIGAYAVLDGAEMYLQVCVVALDGSARYFEEGRQDVDSVAAAEEFGAKLGESLKSSMPTGMLLQRIAGE